MCSSTLHSSTITLTKRSRPIFLCWHRTLVLSHKKLFTPIYECLNDLFRVDRDTERWVKMTALPNSAKSLDAGLDESIVFGCLTVTQRRG